MSKKEKRNSSFWINTIIAFLLAIFLTMASYLGGVYFGLFNREILLNAVNKTSYYHSIIDYTLGQAESQAIPMGLQPEIFDQVFSLDETNAEGKALMQANLEGTEYTPDTSKVVDRLETIINNYLKQKNIKITTDQQANITTFANSVADEYASNLSLPYIKYYTNVRNIFEKLVLIGMPALLVLSAFAVFLLFRLHSWSHSALQSIAYSTLAASLMTVLLPAFLLINGAYKHLNISPEYFYNFIVKYITQSLFIFISVALLLFIISIAIIVTTIYFHRRNLSKNK